MTTPVNEYKDRAKQAEYELAWLLGYVDDAVVGRPDESTQSRLECIREMLAWHHPEPVPVAPPALGRLAAIHELAGKWLSTGDPDLSMDIDQIHDLSASNVGLENRSAVVARLETAARMVHDAGTLATEVECGRSGLSGDLCFLIGGLSQAIESLANYLTQEEL